ncbi:serine hydrolase domain-containing protein [Sphingomonas sp. CJ20]
MRIEGYCVPEFAAVRDAFADNFRHRGEQGAAVCVYRRGQKLVDLWGGWADAAGTRPWRRDTIVCMMSVGKGMAALCLWMLVDRGRIDIDAPVARYWPEFAANGKGAITVDMLVSGRAGLLYADAAPTGAGFDWDVMVAAYAAQAPAWVPGSDHGYHSASLGYLVGEIVRRVDGRRVEDFLEQDIAGPLGVDYGYGTRGADPARVADVIANPDSHTFTQSRDPATPMGRAWRMRPASPDHYNDARMRSGVMPSTNGHGNARAVARIYAALACGGTIGGVRLMRAETIERMRAQSWFGPCAMTGRTFRYARGFFLNEPQFSPMGANPRAFGHPGAGGALGFADVENRIAFAYSPSRMCAGGGLGDRCAALVEAVYA